ncbi:Clavaminate synthase-like protein [Xylariomycetidae sp. FL2044]|nr:Clavaminate synthase-like protein [Xylariomycetidae sp. FL2044]
MLLVDDISHGGVGGTSTRQTSDSDTQQSGTVSSSIPVHPLGVKPLGNQYLVTGPTARWNLGLLRLLPDEMILHLLEYFDSQSLQTMGATCRFLHAFCQLDELWKALFLELQIEGHQSLVWKGSWRYTFLGTPPRLRAKLNCSDVYSDVLHRPFACSHVDVGKYSFSIPQANLIHHLEALTYDEFATSWSDTPFILTKCIQSWPVFREWNIESLRQKFANVKFRAEAVDWPFATYYQYMSDSSDESPLYLFDRGFAEKMNLQVGHCEDSVYWPPDCFGPDLFEVLQTERPAHRWLIVGPERSGSTFHKDPNATSAWNAVIEGSKYWIMFPPAAQVPGVYVSEDSSEVTSPLSIAEWLLEFHAEARKVPGCVERVCQAGEILHVPSGWWHLVVNLENGIAITQNFVPKSHLVDVLFFLRDKPEQVTGFKKGIESPYNLFLERLTLKYPQLTADALQDMERRSQAKKRKWDEAVGNKGNSENGPAGFSFGFGGDEDDEIP